MKGSVLPFAMLRDVIGSLQHKPHKLAHIKRVVGKLRMVPEGGMVTLPNVLERAVHCKWTYKSIGKHHYRRTWVICTCQMSDE